MANTISILITAYGAQAKRELSDFDRGLKNIGDTAGRVGNRLALFGGAGAAGLALFGRSAFKAAASMEQTRVAFTTMLHSSAAAKASLQELSKFARETPFQFGQVTDASKKLLAYGYTAKQLIPTLTTLGDAAGALGLDAGGLDRLIVAFGQIKAKAVMNAQDLRQLAEAGIPVFDILSKKLGLTSSQIQDIGKHSVSSVAGLKALTEGIHERFGGGMAAQAKTMNGIISNLQDLWTQFLSNAEGTGIGDMIAKNAKPALESLYNEVMKLKNEGRLDEWAKSIGAAFGDMAKKAGAAMNFMANHPDLATGAAKWGAIAIAVSLVGAALAKLTQGLMVFYGALRVALPVVLGLGSAMRLFGTAVAMGTMTLTPLGAAIAAIAAAVALLLAAWTRDWFHIREVAASFFGWFKTNAPGIGRIWEGVTGGLVSAWKRGLVNMQDAWGSFATWVDAKMSAMGKGFAAARAQALKDSGPSIVERAKGYVERQTAEARADRVRARIKGYASPVSRGGGGLNPQLKTNFLAWFRGGQFQPDDSRAAGPSPMFAWTKKYGVDAQLPSTAGSGAGGGGSRTGTGGGGSPRVDTAKAAAKKAAEDAARAGQAAGKAYADAYRKVLTLDETPAGKKRLATYDLNVWGRGAMADAGRNAKAAAAVKASYAATALAIDKQYYADLDAVQKESEQREKDAAEARHQRMLAEGQWWADLVETFQKWQDAQKAKAIADQELAIAEQQFHVDWMADGKEKQAATQKLIDLRHELMRLQGQWVPPSNTKAEQDTVDAAGGKVAKQTRSKRDEVDRATEAVADSMATRLTDIFAGKKPIDAWKAFMQDLKSIFFDTLKDLIKAWILHELKKIVISKAASKEIAADEAATGGGGGGLGGILSGLFGGNTFKALGAAGGILGLVSLLGGGGILKSIGKAVGGIFKGVGKVFGGLFKGIGGLFGGLFGGGGGTMSQEGADTLGKGMFGSLGVGRGGTGAINLGLAAAMSGYHGMAFQPAAAMAGGGGSIAGGRPVNVTQNIHNYQARTMDAYDSELAARISRATRAR